MVIIRDLRGEFLVTDDVFLHLDEFWTTHLHDRTLANPPANHPPQPRINKANDLTSPRPSSMMPNILLLLLFLTRSSNSRAQFSVVEQKKNSNTLCDNGPDALTAALALITGGQPVPQYCIPNPVTGGQKRCYYLFVPSCASNRTALVMNAHGGASCPVWSTYYDRWTETALRHCFAVFYPIGVTDPNVADDPCMSVPGGRIINGFFSTLDCCCTKNNRRVDPIQTQDVSVLFRMVQDIAFEKRIDVLSNGTASLDETRIYMGGHSNGCVAALAMGAIFSNLVAAVCCHAGGGFTQLATNYNPVPTWLAQGMKDDRIWYQFAQDTYRSYGWVHSCENETSVMVENKTAVEYTRYNCNNNATVKLFLLNESGHIPFMNGFEISEGASQTTVDTTEMAWQFCSNFSKEEIPVSLLSRSSAPSWIAKGSLVIIMIQLIIEMI